jgi:ketosteroid isomerase-like protein
MISNDGHTLFPSISADEARKKMSEVYKITERNYRFINECADVEKQTVMIEFIEWYPNPSSGQMYCTPQVAICEIRDGKIRRTRHYMDPRTTFLPETNDALDEALS